MAETRDNKLAARSADVLAPPMAA